MKITTRLILSFLLVSIVPLAAVGYMGLRGMNQASSLILGESTGALRRLGEDVIHQKALSVARQVELYLRVRPELLDLSLEELRADETLAAIAVQQVGETGYTAVYDSDGVTHFHANSALVGRNMRELADSLPAFWAIFEASLDGSAVAGYYEWQDADGSIRDKYMSCVPVGGTNLRVAATTYIDEFSQPIRDTEAEIVHISQGTLRRLLVALAAVGLVAFALALWLAWGISRPIHSLTAAAGQLEQGEYRPECLATETARKDDLGRLARVFDRMAREVRAREIRLYEQIKQLRIQIDEAKLAGQVAKITETEYFRQLQERVKELREHRGRDEE